jgi:AcrR family transcriptional regulator
VAACCKLLSERGYAATSPAMIWTRAGVTRGSSLHYFPQKELLGLAAIEDFARRDTAYLREHLAASVTDTAEVAGRKGLDAEGTWQYLAQQVRAALYMLFSRRGGHALIRLLADPDIATSPNLMSAVRDWLDVLHTEVARTLTAKPVKALGVNITAKQAATLAARMLMDTMGEALPTLGRVPPLQ